MCFRGGPISDGDGPFAECLAGYPSQGSVDRRIGYRYAGTGIERGIEPIEGAFFRVGEANGDLITLRCANQIGGIVRAVRKTASEGGAG